MASRKSKPQPVRRHVNVREHAVAAPDICTLSSAPSVRELQVWWEHAMTYTQAMHGVGRVVLVEHNADEDTFYLTSTRASLDA